MSGLFLRKATVISSSMALVYLACTVPDCAIRISRSHSVFGQRTLASCTTVTVMGQYSPSS